MKRTLDTHPQICLFCGHWDLNIIPGKPYTDFPCKNKLSENYNKITSYSSDCLFWDEITD
jgi:hypothetical protein